jgi:hypothetical protein
MKTIISHPDAALLDVPQIRCIRHVIVQNAGKFNAMPADRANVTLRLMTRMARTALRNINK